MKKSRLVGLIFIAVGLILLGSGSRIVSAGFNAQSQGNDPRRGQLAASTDLPTPLAISEVAPTPEERVLPPVWSNAGLVLGASLLVLIIVGGVLGARQREKH
jgi:hypothetical protein